MTIDKKFFHEALAVWLLCKLLDDASALLSAAGAWAWASPAAHHILFGYSMGVVSLAAYLLLRPRVQKKEIPQ